MPGLLPDFFGSTGFFGDLPELFRHFSAGMIPEYIINDVEQFSAAVSQIPFSALLNKNELIYGIVTIDVIISQPNPVILKIDFNNHNDGIFNISRG